MKTCIFLFIIGILLSTTLLSQSSDVILLTEENTVTFRGEVNEQTVAKAQQQLGLISSKLSNNSVIYLVIDSPGGSVTSGNQFIDFANSLPQKIKPICVFCASMGYHMFQSFDERLVNASSTLMSHRVSIGGLSGQIPGEAITRINSIINTSHEMDVKVAKRVGLSLQEYQTLIYDELWLTGTAAVGSKHADKLVKARCDAKLLKGTDVQNVDTVFGPVELTISKCPLISGILGVKFNRKDFRSETEVMNLVRKVKRTAYWNF